MPHFRTHSSKQQSLAVSTRPFFSKYFGQQAKKPPFFMPQTSLATPNLQAENAEGAMKEEEEALQPAPLQTQAGARETEERKPEPEPGVGLQAKLTVGAPNDPFEREADAVADQVVQRMETGNKGAGSASLLQAQDFSGQEEEKETLNRKSEDKEEEENLQTKPIDGTTAPVSVRRQPETKDEEEQPLQTKRTSEGEAPSTVRQGLERTKGAGQAMAQPVRESMENAFGRDLSEVRLHTGETAQAMNRDLNALAFTHGRDVYFNNGELNTESREGRHLLAHELTHVVQQNSGEHASATRVVQRQKGKSAPKKGPPPLPKTVKLGEVRFSKEAARDVLSKEMATTGRATGALFEGGDNFHIYISTDGRLGYDTTHKDPEDPFRWEKVKELVDLGIRVSVKQVGGMDDIPFLGIRRDPATGKETPTRGTTQLFPAATGLTLVTESVAKSIWPSDTMFVASSSEDTHEIYYTLLGGSAETSSLSHELLGHLWLAVKGVAWGHPPIEDKAEVARRGTLYGKQPQEQAILDPYGNVYTGTVRDFIDTFVGSESVATWASPTQFVSRRHTRDALEYWKKNFGRFTTGTLNGDWTYDWKIGDAWRVLNINYAMLRAAASIPRPSVTPTTTTLPPKGDAGIASATPDAGTPGPVTPDAGTPGPATAPSSETMLNASTLKSEIDTWYTGASVAEQYRFMRFIRENEIARDFLAKTVLTTEMRNTLKPPAGMNNKYLEFPQ